MNPLTFEIERDGNEFHTWCPELPGCHTHGKTVKQAIENLKEAVQLYLEVLIFYKYFAALPLDNDTAMKIELNFKKVQRTTNFVERLYKDWSIGAEHRNSKPEM